VSSPVFVAERELLLSGPVVRLDGPEGRHAATVRRLRVGEPVDLTDGRGLLVHGAVVAVERDALDVAVQEVVEVPPPQPRLVVVQALPKGDRGELAVELMTEVGVDEVVPWSAARCVTVWRAERAAKALGRWQSAARESAKQSRRPWHPTVAGLASTADVLGRVEQATLALVLHESADQDVGEVALPAAGEVLLVVGPEGGLADDEVRAMTACGAAAVRLGPTVLRTSTAGVVAASALLSRTARWSTQL
jgi:16S rRNA (uracil1498-N3)-methyltransferase